MAKIHAPNSGDKQMLESFLGKVHIGTPDDEVRQMMRERLKLHIDKGHRLAAGQRTMKAWEDAAVAIHHKNRDLATKFRL
jgi:hypothetical protein